MALSPLLILGLLALSVAGVQGYSFKSSLQGNSTGGIERRVSGARFTWYNVETGNQVACGGYYHNSDAIVALSLKILDKATHCGKGINIHYGGKTVHATIVDGCEECPATAIDLSPSLFASLTEPGMVYGDWEFADNTPAPQPSPSPTPTATRSVAQPPAKPTTYAPAPTRKPTSSAIVHPIPSGLTDGGSFDRSQICRDGRPRQRSRHDQAAAAAARVRRRESSSFVVERSKEDM